LKQEDTPWDPTSPRSFGEQHYVFQLFYSYTGEALDYKTFVKRLQVMDEAATDVYFDKKM
jgi:glutamine synthetase type III